MSDSKTISIQCKGADVLPLDAIEDLQGNLKKRSKKDIDGIIKSIERYGFSFPFFVWNGDGHNRCMDGHGRIQALCEMRKRGVSLPLFPVAYIDAVDENEAKQKLLRLNSQYGQMSMDSVLEFTSGLEVEWDELALPDGETMSIGSQAAGVEAGSIENEYTRKVTSPSYEPSDIVPELKDLIDTVKTQRLIDEIKSSGISEDEKDFLIQAAKRHTVFNYRNIADYYSNADTEMQGLMESSALVIIDFNKAIENGYVKLSEQIAEQYKSDYDDD